MGMCDDVTEKAWPCSYFIVLRDPVARIVSSYFYCKREPDDMLCASPQLDARNASLREWAVHQRSFLLVSLDTPDPRALGRDAICRIASILQTLVKGGVVGERVWTHSVESRVQITWFFEPSEPITGLDTN